MTTYTAIPDTDIDPDSPITTGLMTLLRDNPIAITEGAAGAPSIVYGALDLQSSVDQTDLAADSVGQSELKVTSGTVGGSISAGGSAEYTLSGGNYGLSLYAYTNNPSESEHSWTYPEYPSANSYQHRVGHYHVGGSGADTQNTREYYINSSPPYDLGDGEIPLFIYVVIDNTTGIIEHFSEYVDPVWAYNGKTNIRPSKYTKDGKAYCKRKDMSDIPFTLAEAKNDIVKLREYTDAFKLADEIEVEITQEIKNADMNDVPHPFMGNDLTGKTVALLDPVSTVMEDLLALKNHDSNDVPDILMGNYLKIGNSMLQRNAPNGLLVPSVKWNLTK